MKTQSLLSKLNLLSLDKKVCFSVVGAGGKTRLIYELARELTQRNKKIFITTTTHMYIPPKQSDLIFLPEELITDGHTFFESNAIVVAGKPVTYEKFTQLRAVTYTMIARLADIILIESDGAKHKPLKIPAAHEPVIHPSSDCVIIVCSLFALGKKAKDMLFRYELGLEQKVFLPNHIITIDDIVTVLTSANGSRKGIRKCHTVRYVITQVNTRNEECAKEIQKKVNKITGDFVALLYQ
ncbi:MAG: selenium cofactor biosynthesis protein YqeC [Treponemataceae bacterium]